MWIDRASFLTSTRKTGRKLNMGLCLTCLVFSLTACAQQSDLVKVEKDLGGKITKLDQEKKALAQVLKEDKQEITDALEKQKSELAQERLQALAQLRYALDELRDETLPKEAKDDLEHRINEVGIQFEAAVEKLKAAVENAVKRQGQRISKQISALQEQREQRETELSRKIDTVGRNLQQALTQQGQTVKKQFAAFQKSLGQFKNALNDVKKQFDQEAKRVRNSETKVRQDFDRHLQVFGGKLDADTKSLKTYLETEVKTAIEAINAAVNEASRNLKADIDAQAARLSEFNVKLGAELTGLGQTDALHGENLEEVTRSLAQLRDVLGTTGTQLGAQMDSQDKGLAQTARRIEQLEGQYAALAKKMDADLKNLHGYLDKDVRPSLESIAKAFAQEKNRISQEFIKVSSGLQRVEQTNVSNVTRAQKQLDVQAKHVQELSQAVAGMREVLDSMAGVLGNRTDQHMHQLGQLTARLAQMEKDRTAEADRQATNTQAVSSHLDEVTTSVQSVGQSFEQFKTLMASRLKEQATRIESQARQLSKLTQSSAAVSNLPQGLKANVTQLNELTKSVAQLKEVVRSMGEKLGSKVDAHESQLIEVEQALKTFTSPAGTTSSKPAK